MACPEKLSSDRKPRILSRQGLGPLEDGAGQRAKSPRLSGATSLHRPLDEVRTQACGLYHPGNLATSLHYKSRKAERPSLACEGRREKTAGRPQRGTAGLSRGMRQAGLLRAAQLCSEAAGDSSESPTLPEQADLAAGVRQCVVRPIYSAPTAGNDLLSEAFACRVKPEGSWEAV